jgi:hypothetical protein
MKLTICVVWLVFVGIVSSGTLSVQAEMTSNIVEQTAEECRKRLGAKLSERGEAKHNVTQSAPDFRVSKPIKPSPVVKDFQHSPNGICTVYIEEVKDVADRLDNSLGRSDVQ